MLCVVVLRVVLCFVLVLCVVLCVVLRVVLRFVLVLCIVLCVVLRFGLVLCLVLCVVLRFVLVLRVVLCVVLCVVLRFVLVLCVVLPVVLVLCVVLCEILPGVLLSVFITISPLQHSTNRQVKINGYNILDINLRLFHPQAMLFHQQPNIPSLFSDHTSSSNHSPEGPNLANFIFEKSFYLLSPVLKSTRRKVSTYRKSKSSVSKYWAGRLQCLELEDRCCHYNKLCN